MTLLCCNFSLLLLFFFNFNLRYCLDRLPKSPQRLPVDIVQPGKQLDTKQFAHIILNNPQVNATIPHPDNDTLRLVQYNANIFTDLHNFSNNVEKIRSDIDKLKPAIIALIEVPKHGQPYRDTFDAIFETAGFSYSYFYGPRKFAVGNMILSRVELENKIHEQLGDNNFALSASFRVNTERFHIIIADIAKSGNARHAQVGTLGNFVSQALKSNYLHNRFLIFGNVDDQSLGVFLKDLKIQDGFKALGWKSPEFTHFKGDVRDYILCSERIRPNLIGIYLYLTSSSPHMPLVVDLYIKDAVMALQTLWFFSIKFWFIVGSASFVLIVSAIGFYYWVQSKLYDF